MDESAGTTEPAEPAERAERAERAGPTGPTSGELAILRVLWKRGPSTVREVHSALNDGRGYTTVLKLMQIMATKGLVLRDEARQAHIYRPAMAKASAQRSLARGLLQRAFDGSASKLLVAALSGRRASREELAELRELLDQLEQGMKLGVKQGVKRGAK